LLLAPITIIAAAGQRASLNLTLLSIVPAFDRMAPASGAVLLIAHGRCRQATPGAGQGPETAAHRIHESVLYIKPPHAPTHAGGNEGVCNTPLRMATCCEKLGNQEARARQGQPEV
jgi:hypothetical protein